MEEKNTYILKDDHTIGTVQIADDVVAMIANYAAKEVEGVASMTGNAISKARLKGAKGVKIEITNKKVRVDLAVTVEYGYNIPVISKQVQSKVKSSIENMTGLEVTDVNIRIAGVNMQKNR